MATISDFKGTNKTQQVYTYLENLIKKKALIPGDRLLPESKLAKKLNVGVVTVRRAMSMLIDDGIIYRVQGRGTFVAEKKRRGPVSMSCIATLYPFNPAKYTSKRHFLVYNKVPI